jgi:hypothetical protein
MIAEGRAGFLEEESAPQAESAPGGSLRGEPRRRLGVAACLRTPARRIVRASGRAGTGGAAGPFCPRRATPSKGGIAMAEDRRTDSNKQPGNEGVGAVPLR